MEVLLSLIVFLIMSFLILLPFYVTWTTVWSFTDRIKKGRVWLNDVIIICLAPFLTIFFGNEFMNVSDNHWTQVNVNNAVHAPLWPEAIPTFLTLVAVSLLGFVLLKLFSVKKLPPLLSSLAMSGLYLGMLLSIIWIIQLHGYSLILGIMPLNYFLICLRTMKEAIESWPNDENITDQTWQGRLSHFLSRGKNLPITAFFLLIPLLGLVVMMLTLFGQAPDAMVKMWTETSDWTFSQHVSPPNITYDTHYLCTVGAAGHPKLVKPLRYGVRHGHRVVCNRQLLIANAFEELIQVHLPTTHRLIRNIYDKYGYPFAKHITKAWQANLVYLLMKPLEWFFLLVLYLFDAQPETRIARQYLPYEN